ncbi:MAG: hypothetical protein K5678_12895, partial [Acetatifactor sp.]|nr:hypothetical protein [Acetatifactor sp.]
MCHWGRFFLAHPRWHAVEVKEMGNIYFISGPCGCGKSTLADAYAKYMVKVEKRNQVYVIHGDDF